MRLRGQYTMVIGGLVCSSLLVLGATLLAEQGRHAGELGAVAADNLADSLEHQIEKQAIAQATALADRLVTPLYHDDYQLIAHETAEQVGYPEVLSAVVVDDSGFVIGDTGAADRIGDSRFDLPWVHDALTTGRPVSQLGSGVLYVAAPAMAGDHVLGAAVLEVSMNGIMGDIQIAQARLDGLVHRQSGTFTLTGVSLGVVLVTLSMLSAVGVASGLSGPVVAFAARARRIGRGELLQPESTDRGDEIGDLSRAFDEMATALVQTTVSKDYFDNVFRSMADMLLVADTSGRVVTANPSCFAELGCSEAALRGTPVEELLPGVAALFEPSGAAGAGLPKWFSLRRPSGGEIPVRVSMAPLREAGGMASGRVFVMQNIADRLAAEQQITRSLAEKEILLREIHHRVKNNLQIISSMLSLQGERSTDPEVRDVFLDSEIRIRAMALVHEQLYRSGDLARVDLLHYLDTLSQQVLRYFGRSDCRVELHVDDASREVSVDQAIPIGLIVNELIANAVQHGFAGSRAGTVRVELAARDDGRCLAVCDDGVGVASDFDIETSDSLGLRLVVALTEQLDGRFSIVRHDGTCSIVEIPHPRDAGRQRDAGTTTPRETPRPAARGNGLAETEAAQAAPPARREGIPS